MQVHQTRLGRLWRGAAAFGRGLGFCARHPSLWPWLCAPALLTLAVTILGAGATWSFAHGVVARHLAGGAISSALLWLLALGLAIAIGYLAFLVVSVVATAPFAGAISERSERIVRGSAPGPEGIFAAAVEGVRDLVHTLFSLAIYLAGAVVLLAAHFVVPPAAPFASAAAIVWTGVFFAYDAFDLPLSRRRASFAGKWSWMRRHGAETLGFGVAGALLQAVPLLNLFVPAVAASAGTLLYLDLEPAEASRSERVL